MLFYFRGEWNNILQKISTQLAFEISKQTNSDSEIIAFGLEILFSTIINVTLILAVAFSFGFGLEMIVYLSSFGILRTSAGGYHAKNHLLCFLTYLLLSVIGITAVSLIPENTYVIVIAVLFFVSMILIYIFAPTQTPNRPIFPKERIIFRKRSIFVGYASIFITIILCIFNFWNIGLIVSVAIFTESLTLIKFKNKPMGE